MAGWARFALQVARGTGTHLYVLFWYLAAVPLRHAPRMQRDQACSAPRTTSCSRWLWCCFFSKFSLPCPSRTWLPSRSSTGVADLWKHNLQVSRWLDAP